MAVQQDGVAFPNDPIIHEHRIRPLRKEVMDGISYFMEKVPQIAGLDFAAVAGDTVNFGQERRVKYLVRTHREELCLVWRIENRGFGPVEQTQIGIVHLLNIT